MAAQQSIVSYKSLHMFFVAANSLLLTGFFAQGLSLSLQLALLLWIGVCGIFIVYRFNDFIDQSSDLKFNLKRFFQVKVNLFFSLQFVLITLPVSFFYLSTFRILLLAAIALLGIAYSLHLNVSGNNYRLKKLFLLKNILIGVCWGALVLVGADTFESSFIIALFAFCSMQVVIGSIIRDIPDVIKDTDASVKTLPVMLGIKPTLTVLQILNVLSLMAGMLVNWNKSFLAMAIFIVLWRLFLLVKIKTNYGQCRWTQSWNLVTCLLIFIIVLIQSTYAFK